MINDNNEMSRACLELLQIAFLTTKKIVVLLSMYTAKGYDETRNVDTDRRRITHLSESVEFHLHSS